MSDEKFLLEYEKLLDKGYCDCNEMNCIDNDSPRRILRIAKNLQQENKELKKQLEKKYEKLGTLTAEILYEENTRLANEITVLKTENQKLKEMQREFIEWLENEKKEQFIQHRICHQSYQLFIEKIIETETMILEKYKEIIGDNNGN